MGLFAGLLMATLGCAPRPSDTAKVTPPLSAPTTTPTPPPPPSPPSPRFRTFDLTTPKDLHLLRESLGPERFLEALKLNRVDLAHAQLGDRWVLPATTESWLSLAPFPLQWTEAEPLPNLLAVSLRLQAWAAFEKGRLVRWGPVSTGRRATPTYAGLYHTNWRQKERRSTFNDEWKLKWYVNLHNWNGVSFHQYALPGYPDSHSCVRLSEDDSEWIYRWCQAWVLAPDQRSVVSDGTPVVVFGRYDWNSPPPWKRLADDPAGGRLSPAELREALELWRQKTPPPDFPEPALRPQNVPTQPKATSD